MERFLLRIILLWLFPINHSIIHLVAGLSTSTNVAHKSEFPFRALAGADIEQETDEKPVPQVIGDKIIYRGKVNEIDYCIAPGDVSLSRARGDASDSIDGTPSTQTISLTQALNNATNRAVRRILLAKSWPSEEAFNQSLRLAANAEKEAEERRRTDGNPSATKCPVPRPILNILLRKDSSFRSITSSSFKSGVSGTASSEKTLKKTRSNKEYVRDQINAFKGRYGSLSGYSYAEAYLESILSLATTGEESPRAKEVLKSDVYSQSYRRVISVLKSIGVVFKEISGTDRFRIAKQLENKNICLSMMDTLTMKQENATAISTTQKIETITKEKKQSSKSNTNGIRVSKEDGIEIEILDSTSKFSGIRSRLKFWKKKEEDQGTPLSEKESDDTEEPLTTSRVILCSEELSMTKQLNAFSNIVLRVLLFGDDQELLILSETLAGNDKSFVDRWYPDTDPPPAMMKDETRPGVQYLNALICLLREAYKGGTVTNLNPFTTLSQTYSNSYERLIASLVEMGSGYVRPIEIPDIMSLPKPRTAQEELGRFALWESAFRSKDEKLSYPDDMEGVWEVKDEVGGETIGISTVTLMPNGEVMIAPPLQGLRWRLDPGPTHLDTCTFQVLSEDGTILQYRGFIDRGARLEARFSGRPTRIRGSVMFQMRYLEGSDYWKDMLPVNYLTGATKFEMTKKI